MTVYLLAGGGTAGHVNPLLALAEHIRRHEPDSTIIALGTAEGLEARLVPQRGFELSTIARLPFPRKPSLYALRFPQQYRRAVSQVRSLLRDRGVDVVVGFGGYAAAPAYRAARAEGVPFVIHEANAKPGLANKFAARHTPWVGVTFPGTPIHNAKTVGMPLRPEIEVLDRAALRAEALAHFGLQPDRPTLLVTGGSLGARGINEGVYRSANLLEQAGAQVLHVWGGLTEVRQEPSANYHILQYCDRMDYAFSCADLVISRAGSTTVSELSGLGIPAIFSPYSHGNGEQAFNCRAVVEAGGALRVDDKDITPEWVSETVIPLLLDGDRLRQLSDNARTVGRLDGTAALFAMVKQAIGA